MLSKRLNTLITKRTMASFNKPGVDALKQNDVIFQNINNTKVITLNRPEKLNSLNYSMLSKIYPRLIEYSKSNQTQLIIQNSIGRAFCAGGDVTSCVENNKKGDYKESVKFFQEEYSMNYLLSIYNKPIVSIMDGITMGGGVGLTIHTPFRIATEKTRWAMPEMDIGFSPDVGTTFALNKIVPSSFGWYLALTGENVFGWDTYFSGIATHYVPSNRLESLQSKLSNTVLPENIDDQYQIINNIIEEFVENEIPGNYQFKYKDHLSTINKIFRLNTSIETIFKELEQENTDFARETLKKLKTKSPLSLKIGLEMLTRGYNSNIHQALTNELNAAVQFMQNSDFNEGVSSKLLEKRTPNWKYKSIESIPTSEVLNFFKPSHYKLDKVSNQQVTFNQYPRNFGLPKKFELEFFINGKNGDNLNVGNTGKSDVIHYFNQGKYGDKIGLNEYLNLMLDGEELLKSKL